jgi:hypothetical protein
MIDLRKSAELNGVTPIELYERFKRFPQSHKRVICYCEECGKEREISYYAYSDLCNKCANGLIEKREQALITMSKYFSDPMYREKLKESAIKRWEDPLEREKQAKRRVQYYIEHPEARKETARKTTEQYSTQNARDEQAKRIKKYHKDYPETPEMLIERAKKVSAGKQGILYDEWEDFVYNLNSPYCPLFDSECRKSNREKYGNKCFLCNLLESENITKNGKQWKLSVHHIDMDKGQGCDGKVWKLVPLCLKCHVIVHNKLWLNRITWLLKNVW